MCVSHGSVGGSLGLDEGESLGRRGDPLGCGCCP